MSRRLLLCVLFVAGSIAPVPALGQYQESTVLNAECADVQAPPSAFPNYTPWFPGETGPVTFKFNWVPPQPPSYNNGHYAPACAVKVPVYSAPEVKKMIDDLRGQVLNAIKTGVTQAAIKGDQVETLTAQVQHSVEDELRAGTLREVTELRQQIAALSKRLEELEKKQSSGPGAGK